MLDGWSDKGVRRFLAALFADPTSEGVEYEPVSIQITDAANPASQAEVRERIAGLLGAVHAPPPDEGLEAGAAPTYSDRLKNEIKALHFALLGRQPSDAEVNAMIGVKE